jgi:hypothetical protein
MLMRVEMLNCRREMLDCRRLTSTEGIFTRSDLGVIYLFKFSCKFLFDGQS